MSKPEHPGTQKTWLPGIEALRGFAASTVVVEHLWILSGAKEFPGSWIAQGLGTWGVDLFFMLSGYLLADTFWQAKKANLRVYAIRRIFRIAPAYYVNIGILFLFFAGTHALFSEQGKKQLLASATFTQYLFPSTSSSLNVNGSLWTLTIEMLLYAFLPIMAVAVRRAVWPATILLVGIGVGWRVLVSEAGDGLRELYFPIPGLGLDIQSLFIARQFIGILPVFALGILIRWLVVHGHFGWVYNRIPRASTLPLILLTLPSMLLLKFVMQGSNYENTLLFATYDLLLMLALAPALILAGYPGEFAASPLNKVTSWLGVRSYSIYLWHFPIILAILESSPQGEPPATGGYLWRIPAIVVLTLVVAAISYASIERPGMDFGRRLADRFKTPTIPSTREQVPLETTSPAP